MPDLDLKARLESSSKAFEGLMSLIPAKMYYGEDNSDQWQRRKQSKLQKKAAKKAKLTPGAYKTALDIHKEREGHALKRKRSNDDVHDHDTDTAEQPELGNDSSTMDKLNARAEKRAKKQKLGHDGTGTTGNAQNTESDAVSRQAKVEKRREKRERKQERRQKTRDQREAKHDAKRTPANEKSLGKSTTNHISAGTNDRINPSPAGPERHQNDESDAPDPEDESDLASDEEIVDDENTGTGPGVRSIDFDVVPEDDVGLNDDDSSASSITPHDSALTSANHSSASSSSSIIPPSTGSEKLVGDDRTKQKDTSPGNVKAISNVGGTAPNAVAPGADELSKPSPLGHVDGLDSPKLPKIDHVQLQERLTARLNALRAARKADGPNGQPAKNRAELIEGRRRKEELRKQHKKELRAQARLQKDAQVEAARLRGGSGSPLWSPSIYGPGGDQSPLSQPTESFNFGRVKWDDGAEVDVESGELREEKKRKGPSDVKTALAAAEKKKARVAGFDEAKRAEIEEKDTWLGAKKRVYGEKQRDNASLLKKTLKRKEKGKSKSEKEWTDRIEGVKKGQEMKQKKREENLRRRREEKGVHGKKAKAALKKARAGKPPVKKRPGFEGTFKSSGKPRN